MSGREVCALLAAHGFVEVRQRGSHVVMQLQRDGNTITVPVPNHSEVRRGMLSAIIRQSGLAKNLFEA